MKIRVFVLILGIIISYLILAHEKPKSYHAGFMYWTSPTVLRNHWELALIGTVLSIENNEELSGSIKVHEVIYQETYDVIGKKQLKTFSANIVNISGGFSGLKVGDKVLVLFNIYEGAYAVGNFQGTETKLGIKLKGMDDSIVSSMKHFLLAKSEKERVKILLKDRLLWEAYDKEGLEHRLEVLQFVEGY